MGWGGCFGRIAEYAASPLDWSFVTFRESAAHSDSVSISVTAMDTSSRPSWVEARRHSYKRPTVKALRRPAGGTSSSLGRCSMVVSGLSGLSGEGWKGAVANTSPNDLV